jgi:hypothetical protein
MVVADGILTNLLIQKGIASEANPFLVDIAGEHSLIILKVVGVLACALILWDIYRRNPRLSFMTSSLFLLVYIGIVAWNLRLLVIGIY